MRTGTVWLVPIALFGVLAAIAAPTGAQGIDVWAPQHVELRDLDRDGVPEVITYEPVATGLAAPLWPTAHRWDGLAFRPTLIPAVYHGFIATAESVLEAGKGQAASALSAVSESLIRTRLGHAYTLQDRPEEARAAYEHAWELYQAFGTRPSCTDPADAVRAYYAYQVHELPRSYWLASEERRRIRSFAEFAAGFARTRAVTILDPPRVMGSDGDLYRVEVTVAATDLSPDGDAELRFAGTWQVRFAGGVCSLEGAEIRLQ
jgi:hypothetical protein